MDSPHKQSIAVRAADAALQEVVSRACPNPPQQACDTLTVGSAPHFRVQGHESPGASVPTYTDVWQELQVCKQQLRAAQCIARIERARAVRVVW